jgi:acetyl-CoA synthetase
VECLLLTNQETSFILSSAARFCWKMASSELEEETLFQPPSSLQAEAHVKSLQEYKQLYDESVNDPESFWRRVYDQFYWKSGPTGPFFEYNIDVRKGPISIKWMAGARTNICYNVLDRNVEKGLGDKIAFYW